MAGNSMKDGNKGGIYKNPVVTATMLRTQLGKSAEPMIDHVEASVAPLEKALALVTTDTAAALKRNKELGESVAALGARVAEAETKAASAEASAISAAASAATVTQNTAVLSQLTEKVAAMEADVESTKLALGTSLLAEKQNGSKAEESEEGRETLESLSGKVAQMGATLASLSETVAFVVESLKALFNAKAQEADAAPAEDTE